MTAPKIAFFVNRYPAVSHTFIRREIAALEALEAEVKRLAIRATPAELVDAEDKAEYHRTMLLAHQGAGTILGALLAQVLRHPVRTVRTFFWALRLGRRCGIRPAKMLAYFVEAILLVALIGRQGADHLRVHFGTNAAVVARLVRRLGGPPFSIAYHGPDEFDAPERWDLQGAIAESTFVTAISHYCSAQLKRWSHPADWKKIRIVRCSVDDRFFGAPPLAGEEQRRSCVIARLAPQKGLALLVEAMRQVRQRDHVRPPFIDIIGDGPHRAQLEAMVEQYDLGDLIRFHGAQSGEAVRRLLTNADFFTLASFAEGLPVVIMEAMAMGRPALATTIAGIPELVRPGDNGWLVTAGDVDALVEGLERAVTTPADRLRLMGDRASQAVREQHSALAEARTLLDIIRGG